MEKVAEVCPQVEVGPLIAPGTAGFLVIDIELGALLPQPLDACTEITNKFKLPVDMLTFTEFVPCPETIVIIEPPVVIDQVYEVAPVTAAMEYVTLVCGGNNEKVPVIVPG